MLKSRFNFLVLLCAFSLAVFGATTNQGGAVLGRGHRAPTGTNLFNLLVPAHDYDLILARPEKNSVTLSVLAYHDADGYVAYGTQPGACTNRTITQQFKAGLPVELLIGSLPTFCR